jgi:hypothetical protein
MRRSKRESELPVRRAIESKSVRPGYVQHWWIRWGAWCVGRSSNPWSDLWAKGCVLRFNNTPRKPGRVCEQPAGRSAADEQSRPICLSAKHFPKENLHCRDRVYIFVPPDKYHSEHFEFLTFSHNFWAISAFLSGLAPWFLWNVAADVVFNIFHAKINRTNFQ